MADLVIGLVVAGVMGGGLVLQGIYNGRRAHRRLAELAERKHGVVVAGDQAAPAVAIEVPEGRIVVGPTRAFLPLRVRWIVELADPGVEFRIFPRASAVLFSRKVKTGDPEFDGSFLLEARDREAFLRLWGESARAFMTEHFPEATMTGSFSRLQMELAVDFNDTEVLVRGVDLLLELARADPHGLRVLRSLAGARERSAARNGLPGVTLDGPGGIWIGLERSGDRTVTRARGDVAAGTLPGAVTVEGGEVGSEHAASRLSEEARRRLPALGTARVEWTEQGASIGWPGIETELARLQAAIGLLRALALPPAVGVFR